MDSKDIYWAMKLSCLKMIKTGITCFNDMYWRPEIDIRAITETGMRAVVGLALMDNATKGGQQRICRKEIGRYLRRLDMIKYHLL